MTDRDIEQMADSQPEYRDSGDGQRHRKAPAWHRERRAALKEYWPPPDEPDHE